LKRLVELGSLVVAAFFFLQAYFWTFEKMGWPMVEMTKDFTEARWPLWAILGMISVLPGVFEEIAFRGIIQTKLSRILSVREALVIQAALFSILHLSPIIFVSHFVMGLLLGWARLRLGHVYLGMVLHMSWNAMVVLNELGH
jgi:membrane protease YdiL (CAAX protease family)